VRVPIVPAAVLFDLWHGDTRIRPDASTGRAACEAAGPGAPAQGAVGAGAGATVGKLYGIARAMPGGVGTASLRLGDVTVAALVAVNALGDVIDAGGRPLAGARRADGTGLQDSLATLRAGTGGSGWLARQAPGTATTLGIVATDAVLDKAGATQLAHLAFHGVPRAIAPLTVHDGDTLFTLATGTAGPAGDLSALGALAAEVVARAIRNAVIAANGL
jgi:L-aminopeptidase/D-esterase-like protein